MKKIFLFVLLIQAIACSKKSDTQLAIIDGVWERGGAKAVTLYQVISGRIDAISTFTLQEDKKFSFAFNVPKEGFYVIGTGNSGNQTDKYNFYFKPGDVLSVVVNDSTYVLTGKNTAENETMANWQQYSYPLSLKAIYFTKDLNSTYKDFFPLLEESLQNPFVAKSTGNSTFDRLFKQYQNVDLTNIALSFLYTPRSIHPTKDDYPDFYRNISMEGLTEDSYLLEHPGGFGVISRFLYLNAVMNNAVSTFPSIDEVLSKIKNENLKGEYILSQAALVRTYIGYMDFMDKYGQYITLPDQIKRESEMRTALAQNDSKPGQPAINFKGKDINGKEVSLFDFKGKMVMVDIWATWCGPCIQEIPNIEKLMIDYAGKDIVFMGVSIDDEKDKPKWETFLKDKNLKGIQLFSGKGSDITKFYSVNSIPRFLLFDKNGNIISINAPRPSSPEIRLLIDNGLKG